MKKSFRSLQVEMKTACAYVTCGNTPLVTPVCYKDESRLTYLAVLPLVSVLAKAKIAVFFVQ